MVIISITIHKEYVHAVLKEKEQWREIISLREKIIFEHSFLESVRNDNVSDSYDHSLNCCRIRHKRSINPSFLFSVDDWTVSALNTDELDELNRQIIVKTWMIHIVQEEWLLINDDVYLTLSWRSNCWICCISHGPWWVFIFVLSSLICLWQRNKIRRIIIH